MNFLKILGNESASLEALPQFIREVQEIQGVRVLRLQGPVGKEIGGQVEAAQEAAEKQEMFTRPLLIDFKDTTEWDFSTISYLVQALRRHLAAGTNIGIINPSEKLVAEFEIAKVESMFQVYPSEEAAIAELAKGGETTRPSSGTGN